VLIVHSIPPLAKLGDFDPAVLGQWVVSKEQQTRGSTVHLLLWGRDVSEEASREFAAVMDVDYLVTGHIACPNGYSAPNRRQIIVDCVAEPAACLLFQATAPLTFDQLLEGIRILK
jgi:hypothetical protein